MFIDEAQIRVEAGKGGAGCLSFRREKHTPRGGPDGGDGGRGGSIYIIGDAHLNTLVDFQHQRSYRAQNGRPGAGRDATGRDGEDLEIRVPLGTMIQDAETRESIEEITSRISGYWSQKVAQMVWVMRDLNPVPTVRRENHTWRCRRSSHAQTGTTHFG